MRYHTAKAPTNPRPRKTLSPEDQTALQQLKDKLQIIRDLVVSVVKRYTTGLILTGRGGTGKSWTVIEELKRLKADYDLHNSHMTARGLYDALSAKHNSTHLIEDNEPLFRDQKALGVLRSATWATLRDDKGRPVRHLFWETFRESGDTVFNGGIIVIANRPISRMPEMQAWATRLPHSDLDVTADEIAALMRSVALQGHHIGDVFLEPKACLEVADFLIDKSRELKRALDMRMLVIAFAHRYQAEVGHSESSWQDLVRSLLRGRPVVAGDVEPVGKREQDKARELAIVREIAGLQREERLRVWKEKTDGKSEKALYRRLAEFKQMQTPDQEN